MSNNKQTGNKNKGCGGEHLAMGEATIKGYIVSKTTETDLLTYDFIMDDGKELYRVEVKTQDYAKKSRVDGKKFTDRVSFNIQKRSSKNRTYDYVHYFALVCLKIDKIAWIKYDDLEYKTKKTIRYKDFDLMYSLPINKRLLNIDSAADIEDEDIEDEDIKDNQIGLFD